MSVDSAKMSFKVAPENVDSEVQPLLTEIREWAREIRYRAWIQMIWGILGRHKFLILLLGFLLLGLFIFISQIPTPDPNSLTVNQLILKYGEQGEKITSSNVIETVQDLVQIQKDQQFAPQPLPPWLTVYSCFLVWLVLVMFIRPKVELGIGKGSTAILFWGLWEAFLLAVLLLFWEPIRSKIIEGFKIFS